MRYLTAIIGAVLGMVLGVVIALFVAIVIARNDLFGFAFIGFLIAPVGLVFGGTIGAIAGLRLLPHLRERETQRIQSKKLLVVLGAFISGTTILIGLLIWIVRSDLNPPSDQKLLANFDHHEATLNNVIEMLRADEDLIRVDEDWTDPKNPETIGVSPSRINAYRQMLRDARVPRGFRSEGLIYEVDFFYWMIGSAISSDTVKGYAYRMRPPINLLSSLDGYRPPDRDDTIRVYRHIRGNWYLFYEYIPG
jgi:hypothetical protein